MAALDFPNAPNIGDTWPNPPQTGVPTYRWSGTDWLSAFPLGVERLPIDGSLAMTGPLTLSGPPTLPLHATSKDYVDNTAIAAKAVRYDAAQTLTSTQKAQARANIDVLKKNYIINGAMQISQENGDTVGSTSGYYMCDMWRMVAVTTGVMQTQRVQVATPSGATDRIRLAVNTADTSIAASEQVQLFTAIEGNRVADLQWGTAAAKTVTLQFGFKAPAGTYCVSVRNGTDNRTYLAPFTIAAGQANVDTVQSITIPGDTTGTWAKDNTAGIGVSITLMSGATLIGNAGWQAGVFLGTGTLTNNMATPGVFFEVFDVSLTEGTVAPPFQVPDYASELALCQRYFWKASILVDTSAAYYSTTFPVQMRALPAATGGGAGFALVGGDNNALAANQTARNFQTISFSARL